MIPFRVLLDDEDVTEHVQPGLTYSNVAQGGMEAAQFSFGRSVRVPGGVPVRIESGLGCGFLGETVEKGDSYGRQSSTSQVSCQGPGAAFTKDELAMVFVDSDLSHWEQVSLARSLLLTTYQPSTGPEVVGGESGVGLRLRMDDELAAQAISECWYNAGPDCLVSRMVVGSSDVLNITSASMNTRGYTSADESGTAAVSIWSVASSSALATAEFAGTPSRYMLVQLLWNGGALTPSTAQRWRVLKDLVVVGDHGLTLRGAITGVGLYPSDIVRYIVSLADGVDAGDIQAADDFLIRQSEYRRAVSLEQILVDAASYERWAWGCWDKGLLDPGAQFDFHPYPDGPDHWVPLDRAEGLDLSTRRDALRNRAIVNYTDPSSGDQSVEVTTAVRDLDQDGDTQTLLIDMGAGRADTAYLYGLEALLLTNRQARGSGSFTVRGIVDGDQGGTMAELLRAGKNAIRIPDLPADWLFEPDDFQISRVEVTVGEQGAEARVEIGQGADALDVLSARVQAETARVSAG